MAFLDNSGDIILDMTLTDEGRRRLAKGDGSFNIVKFALGDEEINYSLYNKNVSTALQDLEILQTPVLEAFTNNTSTMHTKLVTIPRTDLLYMPILRLNESSAATSMHASGTFMVAVDKNTENNSTSGLRSSVATNDSQLVTGFLLGATLNGTNYIKVDAGIDNNGATTSTVDPDQIETQFQIDIDNRLGTLVDSSGKVFLKPVNVDDDNIATYLLGSSSPRDRKFVKIPNVLNNETTAGPIKGPITSLIEFKIQSTLDLKSSYYLFDKLGLVTTMTNDESTFSTVKVIDSTIRVSGRTTGYGISIPVRFVKLAS